MFTVYTSNHDYLNVYATKAEACSLALRWAHYFRQDTEVVHNNKIIKKFKAC